MFKKILSLTLALLMVVGCISVFASCKKKTGNEVKVGFIYLHDENSTYDNNFMQAAKEACDKAGVAYVNKPNVPESNKCYEAAVELIEDGCNIIFADSFGHEDYLIQAAREYPNVQFCHATGTKAHTENLANFHNAFAAIYEGRYLAGIAAGMKLKEMIDAGTITAEQAVMGYVGAYTYAEVISGYTSFFLGAKSIVPEVTMKVTFTGEWYHENKEKTAAEKLLSEGCVLISQHADSMGAPSTCENAGVPNVSYNGTTEAACPNTYLASSRINWAPYFAYIIGQVKEGKAIDTDWTGTIANGAVEVYPVGKSAAEGTQAAIDAAKAKLVAGELKVFDTATFTVEGQTLTTYLADVNTDAAFEKDTEAIADGYFHESEYRSAPYFDITIDGIILLDVNFGD